jgi:NAD(P)-dependent dehydrogenase (short-subunit alcohol dehydrogenase family)
MAKDKKVWFVTGSANGLGRNIVEAALREGHRVVATARNTAALSDLAEHYKEDILVATLDVNNEQQAHQVVQAAMQRFGHIDVLVNNAGYGDNRPFEQVPAHEFRQLIETCFFGVVTLTREVLPQMRARKSGHIIQISSVGGRFATAGNAAYHAAKWAVGGFTESLAQECAPFHVKVTALEPGGMRTNWGKRAFSGKFELMPDYEPSVGAHLQALEAYWGNENGDPEKVAAVVLHVAGTEELPPHILLGSDALQFAKAVSEKRWLDAAQWKDVSESVDVESRTVVPVRTEG